MRSSSLLGLAFLVAACAPQVSAVSVTNATIVAGHVAADFPIPADTPRGDLRLASYGVVEIGSPRDEDDRVRALHVRMTVQNDSDRMWTIDTRAQRIDLAGYGLGAPTFASANAGQPPPLVTIPEHAKRVVDLFFALPEPLQRVSELPTFDALWRIEAGERVVTERTPLARMAVDPPTTYDGPHDYGRDYYWGAPYWFNPMSSELGLRGASPVPPRYFSRPLFIRHTTTRVAFAR